MIKNKILENFKLGYPIINFWLSIPNSFTAEAIGKMNWDSITIDLQHGQNDYQSSIPMLQALSNSKSTPVVRVPWNEPGIIMKMLDLGVMGVIAPMINTRIDCKKFVSYCNYPPIGSRSFGPMRAQLLYGSDYYKDANSNIATFAMIETEEAVKNIDEILSVPNLSGIYIGPADMSLSYGLDPKFDVEDNIIFSNIKFLAKKAKEYNKIAGIHNGTIKYAKKMKNLGYNFVTISSDFRSMVSSAQEIINEMKNNSDDNKTSY